MNESQDTSIFITSDQNISILNSHFNFFPKTSSSELHGNYQGLIYPAILGKDKKNIYVLNHFCWLISRVLHAFVLFFPDLSFSFLKKRKKKVKITYLDVINFFLWESRNQNKDKWELWKTFCTMPALNFSSLFTFTLPTHTLWPIWLYSGFMKTWPQNNFLWLILWCFYCIPREVTKSFRPSYFLVVQGDFFLRNV